MKGLVITTKNTMQVMEFEEPLYKSLGKAVGGYIEVVHPHGLREPLRMICNEEGLLEQLELNRIGSLWYGTHVHGHPIVGDIVVVREGMTDDGPDIVGLEEGDIRWLKGLVKYMTQGGIRDLDKEEQV